MAAGCARRKGARQGQSDAARARPPRRRLSRHREPGRLRRRGRCVDASRPAAPWRSPWADRPPAAAGDVADNLVLKAARALAERVAGLKLGRFTLSKRLPVAAGLGGGSADAAAALRLLARANAHGARTIPGCMQAARATGADVPVCLDPRPRLMRGIGDILSAPLDLPRLFAVLVNPGVAVPTRDVFAALERPRRAEHSRASRASAAGTGRRCLPRLPAVATISRRRRSSLSPRSRTCWRCCASCRAAGSRACRARARRVSVCSIRRARRARPRATLRVGYPALVGARDGARRLDEWLTLR